ncbi:MAG: hypothetical protein J6I73_01285 [Treponema sp.]|nr:hypothetical protein [Treponema sp.]
MNEHKNVIIARGSKELEYCEGKIDEIKKYTHEQAIQELIKETKLEEKISVINAYLSNLGDVNEQG